MENVFKDTSENGFWPAYEIPDWQPRNDDGTVKLNADGTEPEDVYKRQAMGCICYENPAMGIYFISDPDGYWLEIVPAK